MTPTYEELLRKGKLSEFCGQILDHKSPSISPPGLAKMCEHSMTLMSGWKMQ